MTHQGCGLSREELEVAERAVRMGDVDYYQDDEDRELGGLFVGVVNALALTFAAAAAMTCGFVAAWIWLS